MNLADRESESIAQEHEYKYSLIVRESSDAIFSRDEKLIIDSLWLVVRTKSQTSILATDLFTPNLTWEFW